MSKSREKQKKQNLKSLKEIIYVLVEGRTGNKSETTYFNCINRSLTNKVIKPTTKKNNISREMYRTKKDNTYKVVVCDTDINGTHSLETFTSELQSYIKNGYTVYISNTSWETWIACHFKNLLPNDYDKTEEWYSSHENIWQDNNVIKKAIQKSNKVCDRFALPHGISTSDDLQTFIREYEDCNNQPFTMIGFLMQSII
ncbi:RloB domain-containing protein [Weissella paramesenteroides]